MILIVLGINLSSCRSLQHQILGAETKNSNWGYYKPTKILDDIKVNNLRIRRYSVPDENCVSGRRINIELSGPIGPDSSEIMSQLLNKTEECTDEKGNKYSITIYMNSKGGRLVDGFKLGKIFRRHGVATQITGGQHCASACAIAFLGGKFRSIKSPGKISFHAPYNPDDFKNPCSSKYEPAAEALKKYFNTFLKPSNAEFLFERTMDHCASELDRIVGEDSSWEINEDAAKMMGITTS